MTTSAEVPAGRHLDEVECSNVRRSHQTVIDLSQNVVRAREHMMSNDFSNLFGDNDEAVTLDAGQVLFQQGEPAESFYVVKSGELQILNGNHVFETVGKGGILGEMALVDGGSRSATVRAVCAKRAHSGRRKTFPLHGPADPLLRASGHEGHERTLAYDERAGESHAGQGDDDLSRGGSRPPPIHQLYRKPALPAMAS
jgi:Cyclic nucleotide-binding domain